MKTAELKSNSLANILIDLAQKPWSLQVFRQNPGAIISTIPNIKRSEYNGLIEGSRGVITTLLNQGILDIFEGANTNIDVDMDIDTSSTDSVDVDVDTTSTDTDTNSYDLETISGSRVRMVSYAVHAASAWFHIRD